MRPIRDDGCNAHRPHHLLLVPFSPPCGYPYYFWYTPGTVSGDAGIMESLHRSTGENCFPVFLRNVNLWYGGLGVPPGPPSHLVSVTWKTCVSEISRDAEPGVSSAAAAIETRDAGKCTHFPNMNGEKSSEITWFAENAHYPGKAHAGWIAEDTPGGCPRMSSEHRGGWGRVCEDPRTSVLRTKVGLKSEGVASVVGCGEACFLCRRTEGRTRKSR
jgi:hypothetical protein